MNVDPRLPEAIRHSRCGRYFIRAVSATMYHVGMIVPATPNVARCYRYFDPHGSLCEGAILLERSEVITLLDHYARVHDVKWRDGPCDCKRCQ